MTLEQILVIVLIGAAAGWLGSFLARGKGLGPLGNIVIGILGSFAGSWILRELKLSLGGTPLVNSILTGAIGAFAILFIAGLFSRKK